MNEVQMAYELAKDIEELSQKTIPTVDAEVLKVSGNVVYLASVPSATADAFYGGMLEVLDGNSEGLRTSIVESASEQIVVAGAFTGRRRPVAGDSVRLSAGPLQEAKVFMFEPDTVKPQKADPYFVTVNITSKRTEFRTLGKRNRGWLNFTKLMNFEVVAEAMKLVGDGDDIGSLRDNLYGLKILSEMLAVIITDFRLDEQNRISGDGGLDTVSAMIQRTGSDTMRHAEIIEFVVQQT